MTLPTIEESLGPPNVECPSCEGEGWVCENHNDKTWGQGEGEGRCECGAGQPCRCRPSQWGKP